LTGIGSVVFRDEESLLDQITGDRDQFHDSVIALYKGELEIWFVAHRNLYTYFMLIILTAWAVPFPKSRFHKRIFKALPVPAPELLAHV
jgi:hypothetical protein